MRHRRCARITSGMSTSRWYLEAAIASAIPALSGRSRCDRFAANAIQNSTSESSWPLKRATKIGSIQQKVSHFVVADCPGQSSSAASSAATDKSSQIRYAVG